jgi:hypothetical protein
MWRINSAQMMKVSPNLKSVAMTAEKSSIQISTNALTATPREGRKIFFRSQLVF